jgi:ribosome modulation factor
MGRKRKQRDIEESIGEHKAAEHRVNSELTDDEKRALLIQHKGRYAVALAVKKAADADIKNICKKAKAECGDAAVDEIKDAIAVEQPGGREKIEAEIARKYRIARWMGLPVASEPRMFEEVDRRPSVDIAYDQGKAAGMAGETKKPPYDTSVPQYMRWMEGWDDGQDIVTSAFKKLEPLDVASTAPNTADTSDPPFVAPAEQPAPAAA